MRLTLMIATLALSACGQPSQGSANGCARSATHSVQWSNANAPDVITTTADGPTCAQAVVTFVARDADGDPLWAFASTYYELTAGGSPPDGALEVTPAQVEEFLASWANVTVSTTGALPEWREGVTSLTESATTFSYNTPFERESYEMMRTRDAAMICFAAAVEGTQCLTIDPASNAPTMIVAYGP